MLEKIREDMGIKNVTSKVFEATEGKKENIPPPAKETEKEDRGRRKTVGPATNRSQSADNGGLSSEL